MSKPQILFLRFICNHVYVGGGMHLNAGAYQWQEKALESLQLKLQVVVKKHFMWILETKHRSSAGEVHTLNA